MKFTFTLLHAWLISAVGGLVIPGGYHLFSDFSLSRLQKAKLAIESQLSSLSTHVSQAEITTNTAFNEVLMLPRTLLHHKALLELGLGLPPGESTHVDLNLTLGSGSSLEMPKGARTAFIYNTTEPIGAFDQINESRFISSISQGFPFRIPQFVNLVNYFLVIPQSYIAKRNLTVHEKSESYKGIIKAPLSMLPLINNCIKGEAPVMVFMLNDDRSMRGKALETVSTTSNYLLGELIPKFKASFFDTLSVNWIKSVGYDSLAHSTFCTTSRNDQNDSYCLKIEDQINKFRVYPAFSGSRPHFFSKPSLKGEHSGRDNVTTATEQSFVEEPSPIQKQEQKQKRQHLSSQSVNDRSNEFARKFSDVTYELAHDPKPIVRAKIGEPLSQLPAKIATPLVRLKEKGRVLMEQLEQDKDSEVQWGGYYQEIERINSQGQGQMETQKQEAPGTPDDRYNSGTPTAYENKKKRFDDSGEFLEYERENESEIENEFEHQFANLYVSDDIIAGEETEILDTKEDKKAHHKAIEVSESTDGDSSKQGSDPNWLHNSSTSHFDNTTMSQVSNAEKPSPVSFTNDREYLLPLSLLQSRLSDIIRVPRSKNYAQVVFGWNINGEQDKQETIAEGSNDLLSKRDGDDCVEISWYSVFRYSIFGQPNFCMDKVTE